MSAPDKARPLAYLLTFTCYGTWLHGRAPGSVDTEQNQYGQPFLPPDPEHQRQVQAHLTEPPFLLDAARRRVVLTTIREVSAHRGWVLLAVHVRSNHVHVVVQGDADPDKMLEDYKAYATRRLKEAGFNLQRRKRWTERGSRKYLWKAEQVAESIQYVVAEQGEPMEVYASEPDASARGISEPDASARGISDASARE